MALTFVKQSGTGRLSDDCLTLTARVPKCGHVGTAANQSTFLDHVTNRAILLDAFLGVGERYVSR